MRLKGRHWVLLWLLIFLGGAVAVVARQTAGVQTARRLHDLREERAASKPAAPSSSARSESPRSRQVLVPMAERDLGLHEPADSEFVSSGAAGRRGRGSP